VYIGSNIFAMHYEQCRAFYYTGWHLFISAGRVRLGLG